VSIGSDVRLGPGVRIATVGSGRVEIGDRVGVGSGTEVIAMEGAIVTIGNDVFISRLCVVAAADRIDIGDGSMLAEMVGVRDHDHDPDQPPQSGAMLKAPVRIGSRVWLGAKCSVVRGGMVGDDSVIGAHALVNKPIDARHLAVGVPARQVRRLTVAGEPPGAVADSI
jgi:acetyltransferase-like isoleucine patch superfamily enzyme